MDADSIVQSTDRTALACKLSCCLLDYISDSYIDLLIKNIIKFQPILQTDSKMIQKQIRKSLIKEFFGVFDENGRVDATSSSGGAVVGGRGTTAGSPFNRMNPSRAMESRGMSMSMGISMGTGMGRSMSQNSGMGIGPVLKSPVINRGTWLRYRAINDLIDEFIKIYGQDNKEIQIVSIGSGSDTRCFQMFEKPNLNVKYFELDFANSCKVKKYSILSEPLLSKLVGVTESERKEIEVPSTFEDFEQSSGELHTEKYHLIPLDLRTLNTGEKLFIPTELDVISRDKPTLVLYECVLCYLDSQDSNAVLKFFQNYLDIGTSIIYDPMGGSKTSVDSSRDKEDYGRVMASNLSQRGITMPSLFEYGTIEKEAERFKDLLGFDKVFVSDMKHVSKGWEDITKSIIEEINEKEFLDELEEIDLINSYYCLALICWNKHGDNDNANFTKFPFQLVL